MKDEDKSRDQLLRELQELRGRVSGTPAGDPGHDRHAALDQASTALNSIMDASHDLIVLLDSEGTVVDTGTMVRQVTGCAREEFIGTDFFSYFNRPQRAREIFQKAAVDGFARGFMLDLVDKTGNVIPVLLNAVAYSEEPGGRTKLAAALRTMWKLGWDSGDMREYLEHLSKMDEERSIEVAGINRLLLQEVADRMKMEAALRESEGRFRRLAENAPDILYRYELLPKRQFTYISPAVRSIGGHAPEEYYADPELCFKLVHPDDRHLLEAAFKQDANAACFIPQRLPALRWLLEDGSIVWTEDHAVPICDESGTVIAIEGIARNISQRKKAEAALDNAHQQLLGIIDFLPDATFVIDLERRVIAWNRAIEEMAGISKQDILGKDDFAYSVPFYGDARPILIDLIFDRETRFRHQYDFILEKGTTLYAEVFVPKLYEGKGAFLWVTASPLYDSSGKLVGAIESIRDVSYHKRAEEALRREKEYVDFIVSTAPNLICGITPDGVTASANKMVSSVTGYALEEIIGNNWWRLFYPGAEYVQVDRFFERFKQGPILNYEMTLTTKSQEKRVISWNVIERCNSAGDLLEIVGIGTDITELKQMQEELRIHAEKIKHFAYSVSHDLKSPIIGITGLTRLLHKQYRDMLDEKGRKYCEQILKSAEQATALVEEINLFIKAKEMPLNFETVKPKEILKMIRGEFGPLLSMRQIEWKEPEEIPWIIADKLSISRVFRNLVDNALKYGGENLCEISIGYEGSGEYHIFTISDDGVGIKEEGVDKIFDLFQRDESSRGVEGTGLGLAIVKELVEKHDGKVRAESGPQGGTTFYISISKNL